ncbi:MAG TPA: hypothetical protein VF970_03590, partial [Gemmatimonadales bacterium]
TNPLTTRRRGWLVWLAFALVPGPLEAQHLAFVGSEIERYYRSLQSAGAVASHPWTLRPFSQRELDGITPPDSGHPWAWRFPRTVQPPERALVLSMVPPRATTYFNSTFPWGYNDGPVWQGKGLTTALSGGVAGRWGPLSLVIAPTVFWAQNLDFPLQANGFTDSLRLAHGRFPVTIDAPQRFGDQPYGRLDPGQSTIRVDLPVVTLGVSTANQWWGPAVAHPTILGDNAAGFPHLFLGTSAPIDLWVGQAHGRLVWGDLRQSPWTQNLPPAHRRFVSGLVGVFQPRGLDGLEIGGSRLLHDRWPEDGLSVGDFTKPFGAFLRSQRPVGTDSLNPGADPDNGLAAIWARWVVPAHGFEFYGEYAKEDDNWDLRDFIGEPENSGGYVLGFRKLWGFDRTSFWGLEVEHLDMRPSQYVLGRTGGTFYVHGRQRQGHTQLGQVLGSEFGVGGVATTVALDRYHPGGRWQVNWTRVLRQDFQRLVEDPSRRYRRVAALDPDGYDVIQALGAEVVLFRGPLAVSGGLTAMYDFNRNFGDDAFNLNAWMGMTWNAGPLRAPRGPEPRPGQGWAAPVGTPVFSLPTPALVDLNGIEVERQRLDQVLGRAETDGLLLRSPSASLGAVARRSGRPVVRPIEPRVQLVHNSGLPFSLNDGPLWAGAGSNALLTAGFRAEWGPVALVLAPQFAASANRPFTMPDPRLSPLALPAGRDSLSSPWHLRPGSIDLPVRFGTEPIHRLYPGQSTLQVTTGGMTVGLSTENHWWGPGIRNAIVLSDNAPGFPHVFVRTARPVRTALGAFEGRLLAGGLKESEYFDDDTTNDLRSTSALALTWRPKWVPDLTVGLTRAVYQPADGWGDVPLRLLDAVVTFPGSPNDKPLADSTQVPGPDQIYSWFGRWRFPRAGLEVYGEFARTELPGSLRDFLVTPGHTLGYTLGLQWARALRQPAPSTPGGVGAEAPMTPGLPVVRLQAEHTYLERSSTFRQRQVGTYYTSRAVIQGYTNQGQVLGAGIGPGSSSHWLAVDYVAPSWEAGLFGSRIRWENDALYTVPLLSPFLSYWCMHDVSLTAGVRGAVVGPWGAVSASLSTGTRYNTFFQNSLVCGRDFRPEQAVDTRLTRLEAKWALRF